MEYVFEMGFSPWNPRSSFGCGSPRRARPTAPVPNGLEPRTKVWSRPVTNGVYVPIRPSWKRNDWLTKPVDSEAAPGINYLWNMGQVAIQGAHQTFWSVVRKVQKRSDAVSTIVPRERWPFQIRTDPARTCAFATLRAIRHCYHSS